MSSGGKKKKRNYFDSVVDSAKVITGVDSRGGAKNLASDAGTVVKDATGVTKAEDDAKKALDAQSDALKNMNDDIAQSRDEAQDAKNAELAQNEKDENRKSARNRQKLKARGSQGRKSTILTGGTNLGESNVARKTLLGQ